MEKRTVKFGTYDTAERGWTVTGIQLDAPKVKSKYVDKPGGDGSWDLTTALTGGIPRYEDRKLAITMELSKGTRDDREEIINEMVNQLDGLPERITLPDRPDHYLYGRLTFDVKQSGLAYAEVEVTSTVAPWFYSARESVVALKVTSSGWASIQLENRGRLTVVPVLTANRGSDIYLRYNGASTQMGAGQYEWPTLLLTPGRHKLEYRGSGELRIVYREAVLR